MIFFYATHVVLTCLLVAGWNLGIVQGVLLGDSTYLSLAIAAIFGVGLLASFTGVIWGVGWSLMRLVKHNLVILGLIGTVIGFVIALSGVDPSTAGEVSRATSMAAKMVSGMSVALYTTLVGTIGYLWLTVATHYVASE